MYFGPWIPILRSQITSDVIRDCYGFHLLNIHHAHNQDCSMAYKQRLLNRAQLILISKELGFMSHQELLHHAP